MPDLRPMPYTPAPPRPTPIHPGINADALEWDEFESESTRKWVEDSRQSDVRLTDAECAAEYWQAVALFQYTRLDPVGDPEMAQQAAWSEVEVWHRFVTHPHTHAVGDA